MEGVGREGGRGGMEGVRREEGGREGGREGGEGGRENSSSYSDPWFIDNMLDSDRSDLSSNLMQVVKFLLKLVLFVINKAYF